MENFTLKTLMEAIEKSKKKQEDTVTNLLAYMSRINIEITYPYYWSNNIEIEEVFHEDKDCFEGQRIHAINLEQDTSPPINRRMCEICKNYSPWFRALKMLEENGST